MNFIEKRIINNKIQRHRQLLASQGLYSLLNSSEFINLANRLDSYDKLKYFVDLYISCDKNMPVPLEVGRNIEDLLNDKNIIVGVHRTEIYPSIYEDSKTEAILLDGLHNYGDLTSGAIRKTPDVTKTISLTNDMLHFMLLAKSTYKGSTGAFVFCFPKKYLNEEGTITDENRDVIYNEQGNIRPDFILGYVDNSYGLMNFMSKKNLLTEIKKRHLAGEEIKHL